MFRCAECLLGVDPTKDYFITVNERKGPSVNFCSLSCATIYTDDDSDWEPNVDHTED